MCEDEVFNILKYKRYASTDIEVGDAWISAGTTYWVNDAGQLHRKDGPALEYASGTKYWFYNGRRHREDGPAVEWHDGTREWWMNGKFIRGE